MQDEWPLANDVKPARVFHVREFWRDEMAERDWTLDDFLLHVSDVDEVKKCAWHFFCYLPTKTIHNVFLGESMARDIAEAFGTSHETWLRLDHTYHKYKDSPHA